MDPAIPGAGYADLVDFAADVAPELTIATVVLVIGWTLGNRQAAAWRDLATELVRELLKDRGNRP